MLKARYAVALTVLLLVQGSLYYAVALRDEAIPAVLPLSMFPMESGEWHTFRDMPIEKEVQDVLRADDTLNRVYVKTPDDTPAYLFIAFFKTQRSGQTPHSPKNCLPGAGWEPVESAPLNITVPGRSQPLVSNRFVVARGDEKSVVLYWYQSHGRIISDEFAAKFWLIADSIRYHRSDSALVKVVVPVRGSDVEGATRTATEFVQAVFPAVAKQLPL
jgi:EpsI family protein